MYIVCIHIQIYVHFLSIIFAFISASYWHLCTFDVHFVFRMYINQCTFLSFSVLSLSSSVLAILVQHLLLSTIVNHSICDSYVCESVR